jgi:hypothetical protein
MPIRSAASFCFNPWASVSSFARRARIEGTTVFAAISQGSFMVRAPVIVFREKVYKHDARHMFMTHVMGTMEETGFEERLSSFLPSEAH